MGLFSFFKKKGDQQPPNDDPPATPQDNLYTYISRYNEHVGLFISKVIVFTIAMYAAAENMRFSELVKGMKLTGMFQMQGCIAG